MIEEPELIVKFCNLAYIDYDNINQTFGLDKLYKDAIDKYGLEEIKLNDVYDYDIYYKVGGSKWNYFLDHIQDIRFNILKQFCYLYLQLINQLITPITKSTRRQELGFHIESIKVYLDNTKVNYPFNDRSNYVDFDNNFTSQNLRIRQRELENSLTIKHFTFNFRQYWGINISKCITELFKLIHITFKYRQIDNVTNLLLVTNKLNKPSIDTDYLKDRPYITDNDILEFCFNHSLNLRKMINYKYTDIGTIQITFD